MRAHFNYKKNKIKNINKKYVNYAFMAIKIIATGDTDLLFFVVKK